MGSYFAPPVYMNEDTADEDVIQELNNAGPSSANSASIIRINASKRPKLLQRTFQLLTPESSDGPFVRVFSWNVLAQGLAQSVDNFLTNNNTLDWHKRRFGLLEEITRYCPDVICLQEVDHYRFLNAFLSALGYVGEFVKKPQSPCLNVPGNNGPDGVALFFKSDKFEWGCWQSRNIQVLGLSTNQVILGVMLKLRSNKLEMFFAVTHLKAKSTPIMAKLREYQGQDILRWVQEKSRGRPVVLCGDFNAEPREAVYTKIINHHLKFGSAYRVYWQEPNYTTWKIRSSGEEKKTVDYIFHSNLLKPTRILNLPPSGAVHKDRFPNEAYPSDHLSLVADFDFNTNHIIQLDDTV